MMLFPTPNSPYSSVIVCVSSPPPRSSSRTLLRVVSRETLDRIWSSSSARMKVTEIEPLASSIIFAACFSPIPAGVSSFMVAVASASIVWKPISRSLFAVAGPTPGISSISSYFCLGLASFSFVSA